MVYNPGDGDQLGSDPLSFVRQQQKQPGGFNMDLGNDAWQQIMMGLAMIDAGRPRVKSPLLSETLAPFMNMQARQSESRRKAQQQQMAMGYLEKLIAGAPPAMIGEEDAVPGLPTPAAGGMSSGLPAPIMGGAAPTYPSTEDAQLSAGGALDRAGQYAPMIKDAAQKYGIPVDVFAKQIETESNFDPQAKSHAGASGIAQFMPGTARGFGIDPLVPGQAIPAAAQYVAKNRDMFGGNLGLALAGYNWGEGNVQSWLRRGADPSKVPGETRKYVAKITGRPIQDWVNGQAASGGGAAPALTRVAYAGPPTMTDAEPAGADDPRAAMMSQYTPQTLAALRARNMIGPAGIPTLPPGSTKINSNGLPHSSDLLTIPQEQKDNVAASMAAIKGAVDSGQGWGQGSTGQPSPLGPLGATPSLSPGLTPGAPQQVAPQQPRPQQIAQAQAIMPQGAPPPSPETMRGKSTQRAAAVRSFHYWSRAMIGAGMLGENGRGIIEAAQGYRDLAKEYLTAEQKKRLDAIYGPAQAAAEEAAKTGPLVARAHQMPDANPQLQGQIAGSREAAQQPFALERQQQQSDLSLRNAQQTPTGAMREAQIFESGTDAQKQALREAQQGVRPQTTINNVTSPILAGVAKRFDEDAARAGGAERSIEAMHMALDMVNSGMISGPGANELAFIQRAGELFGLPAEKSANMAAFQSAMGSVTLGLVQELGAGVSISNADRAFAESMAGGRADLGETSIRRIIEIREKLARQIIEKYNNKVERLMRANPDDTTMQQVAPLMFMPAPPSYDPSRRSSGQAGVAPGASTANPTTREEYNQLAPGTVFTAPDGSLRRKP